ncbi:NEAT domain-containing protein [Lysinibacillus agricola]|uniref:NEAT domain-containing protein n=1 Tax=Lysinibacillus agricola TaxID=2590012 RepID=A0ABX7AU86_9BACI|nr:MULTISPECIES: NEAT domain-containing protein [Lysinibacillus]QQP13364.1 NEAT domain-containing protein [Lysinibacillus agricola]
MINNRKIFRVFVLSTILLMFLPPFVWLQAKAEESVLENGSYQVELSFSSLDGGKDNIFSELAIIDVKNGQYSLNLTINQPLSIRDIHIEQLENELSSNVQTENLVQFDVKDLHQPIIIKGKMALSSSEEYFPFSQELQLQLTTLSIIVPKDEEVIPENEVIEPPSEEIYDKEWSMNYVLLVDGKNEQSIMNTYVNPVAKIKEKNGKYYAHMTILKSNWITGLTVAQQGNQVEPKLISLVNNVRIVEFEIRNFEQPIRMWVKVDIPEISYHHQYFVNLKFDQQQVAKFLNKPSEAVSSEQVTSGKPPVIVKEQVKKAPVIKQHETVVKQQNTGVKPAQLPLSLPLPSVQPTFIVPKEEQLAFDRTFDAPIEDAVVDEAEKADVKEDTAEKVVKDSKVDQQLAQLNIVKIVLLIIICILSGWLLVRRMKNSKKDVTEQK